MKFKVGDIVRLNRNFQILSGWVQINKVGIIIEIDYSSTQPIIIDRPLILIKGTIYNSKQYFSPYEIEKINHYNTPLGKILYK